MNNALLYLGGFVILVLAALFAVPTFVDWNGYRGVFEEQASKVLGRDVRVGGTVNVRLLPAPYVQFEKLRISDSGDTGDSLFRAESFKMWLSVPPLLRGVLQANEIELRKPVLRLAADATGGGNWSTLSLASGTLPFVPADVTLDQVKIRDGILSLNGAQGAELARIDGIQGELTAEALDGPFKFKGRVKWEGAEREVRFSTAKPDLSGDVRFKTSVTVAGSKNTYTVEGRVADLKTKPRVDGELTAKIAIIAAAAPAATDTKDAKPGQDAAARKTGFDVRGKVTGDAAGFKLQDIAMSLDQAGPPQIVTGEASMSWADKVRVDAGLGSKWLDLDNTAEGSQGARPMEAARMLFEALAGVLPSEAETNVALKFDQINLGAQAVSGVRLQVVRAGGPLELKEFRASVPGGGRLALDGILAVTQKPARFEGNLSLDGQSAMRFLAWAFRNPTIGEGRTDSSFVLTGRLHLGDNSVEIRNARADLGALPMRGDLKLDLGERRRLTLSLEGHKIDAGQLFPGSIGLRALAAFKSEAAPSAPAAEAAAPALPDGGSSLFDPMRSDLVLRVRAGELVDGDRSLKNVTADFVLDGNRLNADILRFSTDDGLEVDVTGDADAIRQSPKGGLRGTVAASSPAAVSTLFRLLDLEGAGRAAEIRLAELAPFRLAGTVGLGVRGPNAIDVKADGVVQGGRMVANLRLDAAREEWLSAPVDLTVTVEGPRASSTLAALARGGEKAGYGIEGKPGRKLTIKAAGVPANGMKSVVALKGEGMNLDFSGLVTLPTEGAMTARDGRLRIVADDAREILAIAGLPFGAGVSGLALEGDAAVTFDGKSLSLRPRQFAIGGSAIAGEVTLASTEGKPVRIAADLKVDKASIPALLTPVIAMAPAAPAAEPAPVASPSPPPQNRRQPEPQPPLQPLASAALTTGIWPEQAFDLSVLDRVEGEIKVAFASLSLDEGLTVSDATFVATLEPQRIEVQSLDGAALGGRLTSKMTFEKAPAGVGLTGGMKIAIGGSAPARSDANGQAAVLESAIEFDFAGRALSPAALITDLKGKGRIALADVTLSGIGGPRAVSDAAELALQGKGPASGDALVQAIKGSLKQGQMPLGGLEIPLVLRDGALKLDRVTIERDEDGRLTFDTAIELATLKFDSEWRIEAKVRAKADESSIARVMLPAVPVVYSGKLKDFASIEAAIDVSALERELTVRKMERDVDQLERLRKLDQDKAKQEQERLKALEAEKAKAAAAAAEGHAPVPGAPAGSPPPADGSAIPPDSGGAPTVTGEAAVAPPADRVEDDAVPDRSGLGSRPRTPVRKVRPAAPAAPVKRPAQSWNPFVTP